MFGEKFLPDIVISVPPLGLPTTGWILLIRSSYLNSLYAAEFVVANPDPVFFNYTSKLPGSPPDNPAFTSESVASSTFNS